MAAPALKVQLQGVTTVSSDNLNTYEQTCDTIAQLRGFVGADGVQVFVRGLTAPNDGGAGEFYWDDAATGPDNGINVIVPTGSALGAWIRLITTGSNTIANYSFATTAALLTAFASTVILPNGTIALTAGRTTVGDGGGTEFYYNSSDTTTADNGGTIRVDSENRRWYAINAINSGVLNVKLFGAKGNNSTDDTAAIKSAMTAAAALGADGSAVSFPPGIYVITSKLSFVCSMLGSGTNSVTIKASASFSGTYMLDFNAGSAGQRMSGIVFTVSALGTAGTATTFGSSSAHGGGGPALPVFDQIVCASTSLTVPALQMSSSSAETGAFTGSVWIAPTIAGPIPVSIGQNQDDITFLSPRFTNTGGVITSSPFSFIGSDIILNSPYFGIGADTPSNIPGLVVIGTLPVIVNGGLMESSVSLTNATWGFECVNGGVQSNPQANLQINNLELNVAYAGSSADQALLRVNIPNTVNNSYHIALNGIKMSSGGNTPWNTLFDIFNAGTSANGPVYLTIKDCDEFAHVSMAAAGGNTSSGGVVAQLQGWYRGGILNHTAPQPAAGTRLTWTWVVGINFGPS